MYSWLRPPERQSWPDSWSAELAYVERATLEARNGENLMALQSHCSRPNPGWRAAIRGDSAWLSRTEITVLRRGQRR